MALTIKIPFTQTLTDLNFKKEKLISDLLGTLLLNNQKLEITILFKRK
jgi:hypothetical protein